MASIRNLSTPTSVKREQKKSKRLRKIKINPALSYAENHIWSQQFKYWGRYRVRKPRLPTAYDNVRWVDMQEHMPKTFTGFVGKHNQSAFNSLNSLLEKYEAAMLLPDVLTIYGPSGTGKSAITHVFVNKLIDEQNLSEVHASKWCLQVDAKNYTKDFNTLWSKLTKFADNPLERFILARFRYVVIENYDLIPPSAQQGLKKVMEAFPGVLKYLMVCRDPRSTMIGFVLTKSTNIRTKPISERDCLQVILSFCSSNRIGFEREGVRQIFTMIPHYSLSEMIDLIQKVFVQEHYLSKAFVLKVTNSPPELLEVTEMRAVEPLQRCRLCTLLPPCQHISQADLNARGAARRLELPRYKKGSMACPEFVRYGYCSMFNKNGHCTLDHPRRGLHQVVYPPPRCKQCTITWPCNHCDYTKPRADLMQTIGLIYERIARMKNINIPEPPMALIRHLNDYPTWRDTLQSIGRNILTTEHMLLVESINSWIEHEYSIDKNQYIAKNLQLRKIFEELLNTIILEDTNVALASIMAAKAASRNQAAGTPPASAEQQQHIGGLNPESKLSSLLQSKTAASTTRRK